MRIDRSGRLTDAQEKLLLAHLDGPQMVEGPYLFRFISLRRSGLIHFEGKQQVEYSTLTPQGSAKARAILRRQADALAQEAMA